MDASFYPLAPTPAASLCSRVYVLCRSTARREKEIAIRRRFSTRLEDRLRGLEKRVATGRLKDRAKIERLLGRLQASYASVADLYEMAVRDEDGQPRLHWTLIEDRRAWRDARDIGGRKSDQVVADGPYSLCRHPLYLGRRALPVPRVGAGVALDLAADPRRDLSQLRAAPWWPRLLNIP